MTKGQIAVLVGVLLVAAVASLVLTNVSMKEKDLRTTVVDGVPHRLEPNGTVSTPSPTEEINSAILYFIGALAAIGVIAFLFVSGKEAAKKPLPAAPTLGGVFVASFDPEVDACELHRGRRGWTHGCAACMDLKRAKVKA